MREIWNQEAFISLSPGSLHGYLHGLLPSVPLSFHAFWWERWNLGPCTHEAYHWPLSSPPNPISPLNVPVKVYSVPSSGEISHLELSICLQCPVEFIYTTHSKWCFKIISQVLCFLAFLLRILCCFLFGFETSPNLWQFHGPREWVLKELRSTKLVQTPPTFEWTFCYFFFFHLTIKDKDLEWVSQAEFMKHSHKTENC